MPKPKKPASPAASAEQPLEPAIALKSEPSAVSEFVEHELPTASETERFEEFVEDEVRQSQIDAGLEQIYHDDTGQMVDVKTMEMKRGRGPIYRFFITLLTLAIIAGAGWELYNFYLAKQAENSSAVSLSWSGETEAVAGQEVTYTLAYKNLDQVDIEDITINVTYPANFIPASTSPELASSSQGWHIDRLASRRSDQITIKGRIVGEVDQAAIFLATMSYKPANFSSEFEKEASFNTKITGSGLEVAVNGPSSVLVGDEVALAVKYKAADKHFLPAWRLSLELADNIEMTGSSTASGTPGSYLIASTTSEEKTQEIRFKFKQKTTDQQTVNLIFDYTPDGEKYYTFLKKPVSFDVVTKNLNLNLIINGSANDQGVDFGQTLNYSIGYANKGEANMKDVVIMALLDGAWLDWKTLDDKNQGQVGQNRITWTKDQLPALGDLAPGSSGTIDFSIKLAPAGQIDPTKNYQIKSYARFTIGSVGSSTDGAETDGDKSNAITNKINSDLSLKEEARYFNEDNLAVGSGPVPPKVGETTSFKVYWHLSNSLNELSDLKVETTLPAYVSWDGKNRSDIGRLDYDAASRKVTWQIGRLPITVYNGEAEFNISITPTAEDKNKLLILLPGTDIEAVDSATQARLKKTGPAKTTKLEDDDTVTTDGRVQ